MVSDIIDPTHIYGLLLHGRYTNTAEKTRICAHSDNTTNVVLSSWFWPGKDSGLSFVHNILPLPLVVFLHSCAHLQDFRCIFIDQAVSERPGTHAADIGTVWKMKMTAVSAVDSPDDNGFFLDDVPSNEK